ncbi:B-cell receptor CD22-like isoform X2 [Pygocentrus nattereri]|uniref:B-cell receptor CD22-like isoform X2 n=1 Tax=Pygocentrus nattereri TaxID=42514 RepID=UPI001891BA2A|nr:B-cell receptor CD22-like isoform X2 [Pygocentrus nattereri]
MDRHRLFLAVSVLSCLGHGWEVQVPKSTGDIIQEFRGRTSVPGSPRQGDCSLQLNNVRQEDNGISLYPWIYPETSSNEYKYIEINIVNPEIHISVSSPQTDGNLFSATCTVRHSCPSSPPPVQWVGLSSVSNSLISTTFSEGLWTSVTRAQFRANRLYHSSAVSCRATLNSKFIYSTAVGLNVFYAPTDVKVGGADAGVVEGATISLTCTSKSKPEPTDYEWLVTQKGSTTTRRASRTFSLGSVKRDTSVSCTARNSVGRGQSESVLLNVRYAPTDVKVGGADAGVVEGATISLTCTSKSNPEPTDYEWLVTQNGSTTTHRASRTFPLGSVKRDTSVSCTARNSVGRGQSNSVQLNVRYAPTDVKVGGADAGVVEGATISLTCTSKSNPEPTDYEWLVTQKGSTTTHRASRTFPLGSVKRDTSVSCTARNSVGRGQSNPVLLNVHYAPTDVKVGGADEGVVEGATISLTCTSNSNPEPTDYEWLVTQKGSTTTRRAPRTFPLGSVKRDTSVSCTARNSVGRGQSESVLLNVHYVPTDVKVDGADEGVVEGATISLTCTSKSKPEPTDYEWLVTQKGSTTTHRASRTFPLGSVKRDTSVSCTARNSVGRGQSNPVLLNVRYAPTDVKVGGADEGVVEGATISLTCTSKSNPVPTDYEWLVTQKGSTTTHRAPRTFPLGSVKRDTSVSCTACNSVGRGQSESVLLNVHYTPTDVKVGGADEGVVEGATISLTCTSKSNPEPTDYEWLVTQKGSTTTRRAPRTFPLGSVKRDTSVSCTARNSVGRGQSESVLLNVRFPPTILMNSACFTSAGGVRCVCRAEAEPKASIFWTVDGSSAVLPHFNTTSKYAGRLVVSELRGPLASNVSCKASNIAGTDAYQMLIQQSVLEGSSGLITAAVVSVVCIILGITVVAFFLRKRRQRPADSAFRSRTESSGKNIDQFKTNDLNLNDNIYMNNADGEDIYANTMETNQVDWNDIYQNY